MATLYVTEFALLGTDANGRLVPVPTAPSETDQAITIGGTSTQSAAFASTTRFVMLHPDAACSVKFGANPTATATTLRMATNDRLWFAVTPGHKVAVITNS